MEKYVSECRLGKSVTKENVTIIPIERITYCFGKQGNRLMLFGGMNPVAVIIVTSGEVKVLDMTLTQLSKADIEKMAPGLAEKISQHVSGI